MALTLTTEAEITRAAGIGAPTAITSVSATVVTIGENAEAIFCADTGVDWVTGVASIATIIKKAISRAVACKAALEIIANDRSGYYSQAEQQLLCDINTDIYNSVVKKYNVLNPNAMLKGVTD
jgi:hypothetical protein